MTSIVHCIDGETPKFVDLQYINVLIHVVGFRCLLQNTLEHHMNVLIPVVGLDVCCTRIVLSN